MIEIEFDENKRYQTLIERNLDFADANQLFLGLHFTNEDCRKNYGERRYISIGTVNNRLVVVAWTYRPSEENPMYRRIISMRKANEREIKRYCQYSGVYS